MSADEQALIAAVAVAPDDDTPRLVLADWLMERGDARGAFIALQCGRARAEQVDAPWSDEDWQRERTLWDANAEAWTRSLPAAGRAGYTFARGFPDHLCLHAPDAFTADNGPELLAAAPTLRTLGSPGLFLAWHPHAPWGALPDLELFELGYDIDVPSIELHGVRRLSLPNVVQRELPIAHAASDLEHFGLVYGVYGGSDGPMDGAPHVAYAWSLPSLRSLVLGNMRVDLAALAGLRIQRLGLFNVEPTPDAVLALVERNPALEVLELAESTANALGGLRLAELVARAPNLRRLRVSVPALTERSVMELATSTRPCALRRLDLSGADLGPKVLGALAPGWDGPPGLGGLVHLVLQDDPVMLGRGFASEVMRQRRRAPWVPRRTYPSTVVPSMPTGKIQAIKEYRGWTGAGLANAKLAVERISEELGVGEPTRGVATRFL